MRDLKWGELNQKQKKIVAISAITFLVIVFAIALWPAVSEKGLINIQSQNNTQPPPSSTETTEKTETPKLLDATIKKAFDVPGIEITNNESVDWENCELKLNKDYQRRIRNSLEPNLPLNNPYGLFTKSDGTRFDYTRQSPVDLYVSCDVKGSNRYNYFRF